MQIPDKAALITFLKLKLGQVQSSVSLSHYLLPLHLSHTYYLHFSFLLTSVHLYPPPFTTSLPLQPHPIPLLIFLPLSICPYNIPTFFLSNLNNLLQHYYYHLFPFLIAYLTYLPNTLPNISLFYYLYPSAANSFPLYRTPLYSFLLSFPYSENPEPNS